MNEEQPVVFVVDDDPSVRDALAGLLRSVGLEVLSFGSTQEFLQSRRRDAPGCLVLDVRLPGRSGLDFQRELAESGIQVPIVFITGHGDIPMSVRAIKAGAIEFLTNRSTIRSCSMRSSWGSSGIARGAGMPRRSPDCTSASPP
jgi:FixJ family two-component response regulator